MAKLFAQEVPESDGIVEVARSPAIGSRAKIAVISRDSSVDRRRLRRHARVARAGGRQRVAGRRSTSFRGAPTGQLRGERTRRWKSPGRARRAPSHGSGRADQQLSLAIGRRGQNVRASQLTGGTSTSSPSRKVGHRQAGSRSAPSCSPKRSTLTESLASCWRLEVQIGRGGSLVDEKELAGIEGFDEETAQELQSRARVPGQGGGRARRQAQELGVDDDLKRFPCHHQDARGAGRGRPQDGRGPGRLRHRRLDRVEQRKDGETVKHAGILADFDLTKEPRPDQAGARQGRLDQEEDLAPPPAWKSPLRRASASEA